MNRPLEQILDAAILNRTLRSDPDPNQIREDIKYFGGLLNDPNALKESGLPQEVVERLLATRVQELLSLRAPLN